MSDIAAAHLNTARSLAHQLRIPTDSIDFDDFVQEGAVAAWRATDGQERRDPVTYGMVAAKRRILGTLRGKHPMYGSEAEPGHRIHDQMRQIEKREIDPDGALPERPYDRDAFTEAERRIDVERALLDLDGRDREIIRLVGRGHSFTEIGPLVGTTATAVHKHWRKNLQPMLRARLQVIKDPA